MMGHVRSPCPDSRSGSWPTSVNGSCRIPGTPVPFRSPPKPMAVLRHESSNGTGRTLADTSPLILGNVQPSASLLLDRDAGLTERDKLLLEHMKSLEERVQQLSQTVQSQNKLIADLQEQIKDEEEERAYKNLTVAEFEQMPNKIMILRHAESAGNVDMSTYGVVPDYEVPLSKRGWEQATACGEEIRQVMEAEYGSEYKLFFLVSPYTRCRQTFVGIRQAFQDRQIRGVREAVQLREQEFGNFQDPEKIQQDIAERQRFGRFYFRFPNGESGADVYDRMTIFQDHMVRDMRQGKFEGKESTSLVLVCHGITLRVFLMRWLHWTVEEFLQLYNPPNAKPLTLEKISKEEFLKMGNRRYTKKLYKLSKGSLGLLRYRDSLCMECMELYHQEYER